MHFGWNSFFSISLMWRRRRLCRCCGCHMLQLVHVVSPYVVVVVVFVRCAALTPLLHGPSDDDDKMNFHIFLLRKKSREIQKKENAFLFVLVMPPGSETRRLHLIHSTACFSLLRPKARRGGVRRREGVEWLQLQTMPESNVVASFWSAKSFLSVARRISFSGVHNKNACKNANVASGSWSAAGGEGAKSLKRGSTGGGALGGFLFWLNATRNYDTFNYQASDWRAARDLQPACTCSSVQHTHTLTPPPPAPLPNRATFQLVH